MVSDELMLKGTKENELCWNVKAAFFLKKCEQSTKIINMCVEDINVQMSGNQIIMYIGK